LPTDFGPATHEPTSSPGFVCTYGRADAAAPVEPFVSHARATCGRVLFSYFTGLQPKVTVGTHFALTPLIDKNADLIKRFVRAMNGSLTYAQAHPGEARHVVLTYTEIAAKVARRDAERFGLI
jgi:NitT/TauT family transport system substrate-binding protein